MVTVSRAMAGRKQILGTFDGGDDGSPGPRGLTDRRGAVTMPYSVRITGAVHRTVFGDNPFLKGLGSQSGQNGVNNSDGRYLIFILETPYNWISRRQVAWDWNGPRVMFRILRRS